ncbi:lumenal Hsp70 protein [Ascosphaera aggregata]|nr:lumenal Hsp70 protein [Ascosphaera aggregata]
MLLPGRWRGGLLSAISIFLEVLLIFSSLVAAVSSSGVIGIDVGTEYLKAALVQPGIPLEIVLTKDSKRKESASVAFRPSRDRTAVFPERFYGGDALALAPRFPDDVYSNLKTLLAVPFLGGLQGPETQESNLLEMYAARYPAMKFEEIAGRGTVGFKSDRVGGEEGEQPFMVEELLAMQLKQIKANAEALGGAQLSDAVITYPSFYTAEEKRSLQLAAELAGLNVLSLMSDGLAVGLNYATSRNFPSVSDGQNPEYHVIYDMGAGSTTASVLKFQSRKVKDFGKYNKTVQEVYIVGTGWDKTLGGDALNMLIVDDMITKFIASGTAPAGINKEGIRQHDRTMARLWKEAGRLRQILSANSDTSASFETLVNEDVNFRYKLTRAEFEKLAAGHIERVARPMEVALKAAGLSMKDIGSIILHGGASRTPFVQRALEAACNDPSLLRTNVNADEAAVFGAAFKGAELSPAFRVKEIRTYDTPSFFYGMRWQSGVHERQQNVFTPTSIIGAEKQITMKNLDDFEFVFYQQYVQNGQSVDVGVDRVSTQNLTKSVAILTDKFDCNASDISTKLSVRLRPVDGLPEVIEGSVSCEVVEKKNVMDGVKGFFGLGKKSEQTPLEVMAEESITLEETSATVPVASDASSITAASPSESPPTSAPPQTRTEIIPISFTVTPLNPKPIPYSEMIRIKDRLSAFDASDSARIKREEMFNTLESSIYRSRDLLTDDDFAQYISRADLQTLAKRVEEASEWIDDLGADASTAALQEKVDGLRRLVNPALRRKGEAKGRDEVITQLKTELANAASIIELFDMQIGMYESVISKREEGLQAASTSSSPTAEGSTSTISFGKNGDIVDDIDSLTASFSARPTGSSSTSTTSETELSLLANPVDTEDRAALAAMRDEISSWLDTTTNEQSKKAGYEDPVLTIPDLRDKTVQLQREVKRVLTKLTEATREKDNGQKKNNSNGRRSKSKTSSTAEKIVKESKKAEDKQAKDEL